MASSLKEGDDDKKRSIGRDATTSLLKLCLLFVVRLRLSVLLYII